MPEDITYGRMRLDELGAVLEFLKQAYPDNPRQSDADFWRWHFLENPNSKGGIPVWLARRGTRIVGQLATIPVELNVGSVQTDAVWILDLMVDPGFRRRGIMKSLVAAANREYPYMLGSATRKQHSAALLTGLGWTVFSDIRRYQKLLYPGNAVREIAGIAPLRTIGNAVFAPFRQRSRAQISPNIRKLQTIDGRFDRLWTNSVEQWDCSISRSSNYLKWQFERQPRKRFDILGYFDGDEMLGYAVLFFRKAVKGIIEKASISDICYSAERPDAVIDGLVRASIDLAAERRAGSLVTDAVDSRLEAHLSSTGFSAVNSGQEIMAIGPGRQDHIYDPERWHLTRGDSDISIFEHPNV